MNEYNKLQPSFPLGICYVGDSYARLITYRWTLNITLPCPPGTRFNCLDHFCF
jgi:hypothetical protein